MTSRAALILAARRYLGTPYRHHGRIRGAGVDCLGLLVGAMRDAGLPIVDTLDYRRLPRPDDLLRPFRSQADEIHAHDASPGDVLLCWRQRAGEPQHILILSDRGVIHCDGKVVETGFGVYWANRVTHAFRPRGLDAPGLPLRWPSPEDAVEAGFDPEVERERLRGSGCCGGRS